MNGVNIVRAVLLSETDVTDITPAAKVIGDDVAPADIGLPLILLKLVSGFDNQPLNRTDTVHRRNRIQIEMQTRNPAEREALRAAVRKAVLSNQLPTFAGVTNIALRTEGEGPNFYVEGSSIRIAEQDVIVSYTETI